MSASNRLKNSLAQHFDAVPNSWRPVTDGFRHSALGQTLLAWVDSQVQASKVIYPALPLRALTLTPLEQVRVVILGQDPYHGEGQADGLAFSVPYTPARGQPWPPSLRNVLHEWATDLGYLTPNGAPRYPHSGSLEAWAQQGVLLLNTSLTVEQGQPASHARRGWEALTDALIDAVAAQTRPTAFLLWGAHAQAKASRIAPYNQHAIWQTNHPSPLSAKRAPIPFIGSRPFSRVSQFLQQHGEILTWTLA